MIKVPQFYNPENDRAIRASSGQGSALTLPPWRPPRVSMEQAKSPMDLANAIREALRKDNTGVILLQDLPLSTTDPFDHMKKLFEQLRREPNLGDRANAAYTNNLVYKDAYVPGSNVDQKRVIDLSPQRMDHIVQADDTLVDAFGEPIQHVTQFFDAIRRHVAPPLLDAIQSVIAPRDETVPGAPGPDSMVDMMCNYRMVEYTARPLGGDEGTPNVAPRCGTHRDFGSATIIFSDGMGGLQVRQESVNAKGECVAHWRDVLVHRGEAVLLFGWCTAIQSNDRIPAALHRVVDAPCGIVASDGVHWSPVRRSAVFFMAPKQHIQLTPHLLVPGEKPCYKSFTAGELKALVGRKWRCREGTLSVEDEAKEREEAKEFPDQDSIIAHRYRLA